MLKKMKTTLSLCAALLCLGAAPALAQKTDLVVGSGGEGGTYYPVVQQINQFCGTDGNITVGHYLVNNKSQGGSVNNLRNLLNNKIMAGIVQADVAHLQLNTNPAMSRVIALLPLHAEGVHVVVPTVATTLVKAAVPSNMIGLGGSAAVYAEAPNRVTLLNQLQGLKLAAWGGSVVTAKVIKQIAAIGFEVVKVKNQVTAMQMLDSGEVQAVLQTAGAPVKWIEELPEGRYKLLGVSKGTREALQSIYSVSGVSYDNMGTTGGQNVEALSVSSLLMTRTYRTPKMRSALGELQSCVREKIHEIQDTPGTHPAWQAIDPSREMKWKKVFAQSDSAVAGQ